MVIVLLAVCAGLVSAQTISNDLLQTGTGTQEDLSSLGLGTVSFRGVALSTDTGPADTIVQHDAIPTGGGTVSIQVIALHLQSALPAVCGNETSCGSYFGQQVDVHATINVASATNGNISLPQPDALDPSVGSMTVASNLTFDSSFSNIEADIIVVPVGAGVNATPIFTAKGPSASMSASGGTMSMTAPYAYPNSQNFPTVAPYVLQLAGGSAAFLTGPNGKIFRGSLWGVGGLLMGLSLWTVWSALRRGQMSWRPVFLTVLALAAGITAWRMHSYPKIVSAATCPRIKCNPITPEQGLLIKHGAAPAATQCQIIPCGPPPGPF
jgi:hypothetical protein